MKTTDERMNELQNDIAELTKYIAKGTPTEEVKPIESDNKHESERFLAVNIALVISLALTIVSYKYFIMGFGIAFGIMLGFTVLSLTLLIDKFFTKGDTFGIIEGSPLASAIYFVGIMLVFSFGIGTGNSIITNRDRAEEPNTEVIKQVDVKQSVGNETQQPTQQLPIDDTNKEN